MSSIDRDTLLGVLPEPLRKDKHMLELATTAADALVSAWGRTTLPRIYSDIDNAPEWVLDVLATDLDVLLYDRSYSVEVKRALVRDAMYTHRHLGTLETMSKAMEDIWSEVTIEEWFDYNGSPYHFRVILTGEYSAENDALTKKIIKQTKPVRCVCDSVQYFSTKIEAIAYTDSVHIGYDVVLTSTDLEEED